MKTSLSRLLPTLLGLFLLSSVGFAADPPYLGLARQLAGNYEAVAGPGNKLRIAVQPARRRLSNTVEEATVLQEQRLSFTVEGKYNGNDVFFDGFLSLQPQGNAVHSVWTIRHARTGCELDIHPAGDGFEGVTLNDLCRTAAQSPNPGKWEFRTEPNSFSLRNAETGETLHFRKIDSSRATLRP
jgi:hypothetical protein